LKAYKQVKIGNPLEKGILCGPLHTQSAVKEFTQGLETIKTQVKINLKNKFEMFFLFFKKTKGR
jgi:hypothetical protein